jgi:phosphatidate cytidylyltransferase
VLLQRVLTAVVGIPVALAVIYAGGWYLAAAVALLAVAGLRELYRLMAARGRRALPWLGYPLAAGLMAGIVAFPLPFSGILPLATEAALVILAMAIVVWWALSPARASDDIKLIGTLAGHFYVPQLLSYLVRLRAWDAPAISLAGVGLTLPAGACWVGLVMVVCWGMDTAAYAVGKTLGRHKLCPKISPGKTVEGAVGGLLGAVLLTAGLGSWFGLPVRHGLILGAAMGIAGQVGDVFESIIKRRAGVKDSGAILPGHGGILDRFDSLLFNAPLAFFYLRVAVGA